ncbi:MAG TPA: phosphoribosyltransferase family protein [Clostridia bacterium]|nr:phosphoribosyltransferase family protein [Clostridia bacterium]
MTKETGLPHSMKTVVTAEQMQKRIRDIGRQISSDYEGKELHVIGVLENGFVFMADLIRALDLSLVCNFVKPYFREMLQGNIATTEIFFAPELEVRDKHVLLVEGLMQSGITTEFLIRNLTARGAASVRLAVMVDRPSQRRVLLQPDYFGFLIDEGYVIGYGLGGPLLGRNLAYLASADEDLQPSI